MESASGKNDQAYGRNNHTHTSSKPTSVATSTSSKRQATSSSQGTVVRDVHPLGLRGRTPQTASLPASRNLPASMSHYLELGLRRLTTTSRGVRCELQARAGINNVKDESSTMTSYIGMHAQTSLMNIAMHTLASATSGWKTPAYPGCSQENSRISRQGEEADDEDSSKLLTLPRNRVFHIHRADKYQNRELDSSEEEETLERQASRHSAGSYNRAKTHILSSNSRSNSRPPSSVLRKKRPAKIDKKKTKASISDTDSDELLPVSSKMLSNANRTVSSDSAQQPLQLRGPSQTFSLQEMVSSIENPLSNWLKTNDSTRQKSRNQNMNKIDQKNCTQNAVYECEPKPTIFSEEYCQKCVDITKPKFCYVRPTIKNLSRQALVVHRSGHQVMHDWFVLNKTLSSSENSVRKMEVLNSNKPDYYSHLNKSNNAKSDSDSPSLSISKEIPGKILTDSGQDENKEKSEAENNNEKKLVWIAEARSNHLSKFTGRNISNSTICPDKPFQSSLQSHNHQELEQKPSDNISDCKHLNNKESSLQQNSYFSSGNVLKSSRDLYQAKHILAPKVTSCSNCHKKAGMVSRVCHVLRKQDLSDCCLNEAGKEMTNHDDQIKQSPYQDVMSATNAKRNTGLQTRQHLNQGLSPVLVPWKNNFSYLGGCSIKQRVQRPNGCKATSDPKFVRDYLHLPRKPSVSPPSFIPLRCPSVDASAKLSEKRYGISPCDNSLESPRDHHMAKLALSPNKECLNPCIPSIRRVRLFTLADSDTHGQMQHQTASKKCYRLSLKKISTAANLNNFDAGSVCCHTENMNAEPRDADSFSCRLVNDVGDDKSPHATSESSPPTLVPFNQVITCNISGKGSVRVLNSNQVAVVLRQVFDWNFVAHSAETFSENSITTFGDNDQSFNCPRKPMGSDIAIKQIYKYASHNTALDRPMATTPSVVPEMHINSPHQPQTLKDNKFIKQSTVVHMPSVKQYTEISEWQKEALSTAENCAEFDKDSDFVANPCPSPASQPEDWNHACLLCTAEENFGKLTTDQAEPRADHTACVNKIIQVDIDLQEEKNRENLSAVVADPIKTDSSTNNLTTIVVKSDSSSNYLTVVKSDAEPSVYSASASHIENKIVMTDDLTTTLHCVEKTCPHRDLPPVLMCYRSTSECDLNKEQLLEIVLQVATVEDLVVTSKTLTIATNSQPKINLTKNQKSDWKLEDSKWERHTLDEGVVWYSPLPLSKSDLGNTLGNIPTMEKITDNQTNSSPGPDDTRRHALHFILSLNAIRDRKSTGQILVSDKKRSSDIAVDYHSPSFTSSGDNRATCTSKITMQIDDALNPLTADKNKVYGSYYNEQSFQQHSVGKKLEEKDEFSEENPFLEEYNAHIPARQRHLQMYPSTPVQQYDFHYKNLARTNSKFRRILPSIYAFNHSPKNVLICSKPAVLHRRTKLTSDHMPSPDKQSGKKAHIC